MGAGQENSRSLANGDQPSLALERGAAVIDTPAIAPDVAKAVADELVKTMEEKLQEARCELKMALDSVKALSSECDSLRLALAPAEAQARQFSFSNTKHDAKVFKFYTGITLGTFQDI